MDETIDRLRAADPARHTDLDRLERIDPALMQRLRDHAMSTTAAASDLTSEPTDRASASGRPVHRPRRGRRIVVGGLALTLLGGGAAYASYENWYANGGAMDGLTCVSAWDDDLGTAQADATGGPELTGDPVADCQHYQALTGNEPITDAVAFEPAGGGIYVAPADQVPPGSRPLEPAPDGEAVRELEATMRDWVDGMPATCRTEDQARDFAAAELDRLVLTGWTIEATPPDPTNPGACADEAWVEPATRTVHLMPDRTDGPGTVTDPGGAIAVTYEIRDALRAVADQCLPLEEATQQVDAALGTEHHWPTTAIDDPAATCTRIDMEVGGSIQITLRGPATS